MYADSEEIAEMIRLLFVLLLSLGLLATASTVAAKAEPYVEAPGEDWGGVENAVALPDGLSGFFLAGRFGAYGDVDAFTFSTSTPLTEVQANVLVPICGAHFEAVYPSVAIIGAGLPESSIENAPFTVPEGQGVLLLDPNTRAEGSRPRSDWEYFNQRVYAPGIHTFDLPQAGEYSLVVWEAEGNVGAYMFDFGGDGEHRMLDSRSESERNGAFSLMTSGRFLGADCRAAASVDCADTVGERFTESIPTAPERAQVGAGYTLLGDVRDAATCLPIANARIYFEMANPEGEYDDAHMGVAVTNQQGGYRIISDRPGMYEGDPHIHLIVSAPGYQTSMNLFLLADGADQGTMPIALLPD
jgi:hypothetical protein